MSALDQAFIKAYAKEPAPVNADSSSAAAAQAAAVAERTGRAPQGRTSNAHKYDGLTYFIVPIGKS